MKCSKKRPACRQRRHPQTDVSACVRPNIYTTFLSINRGCPWTNDLKRYYKTENIGSSIERFVRRGKSELDDDLADDSNDDSNASAEFTDEQILAIDTIKCDLHLAAKLAQTTRASYQKTIDDDDLHDLHAQNLQDLRNHHWVKLTDRIDNNTIKTIKRIIDYMHDAYDMLLKQTDEYKDGIMAVEADDVSRQFAEVRNQHGAIDMMVPMLYTLFDRGQHPWLSNVARPYLEELTDNRQELIQQHIDSENTTIAVKNRARKVLDLLSARIARFVSAGSIHVLPSATVHHDHTQIITTDPISVTVVIALDDVDLADEFQIVEIVPEYDNDNNLIETTQAVRTVAMSAGELVLFDSRLDHSFGKSNTTRQMVYLHLNVQDVSNNSYTHVKSVKTLRYYKGERLLPLIHLP